MMITMNQKYYARRTFLLFAAFASYFFMIKKINPMNFCVINDIVSVLKLSNDAFSSGLRIISSLSLRFEPFSEQSNPINPLSFLVSMLNLALLSILKSLYQIIYNFLPNSVTKYYFSPK